jgi:hypothetical protein
MKTQVTLKCHICGTRFQRELSIWRYKCQKGQKNVYCGKECTKTGISEYRRRVGWQENLKVKLCQEDFDRQAFDPYEYFMENWTDEWLEERIDKDSQAPCWVWTGNYHCGYPAYRMRHKTTHYRYWIRMRRVFCYYPGWQVYTSCNNIECVNPEHLWTRE